MLIALPLAAALAAPPSGAPTADDGTSDREAASRVQALRIVARGLDQPGLSRDFTLRSPDVALLTDTPSDGNEREGLWALCQLTPAPTGGFRLVLFLSDGRAYERQVPVEGDQAPRTVASVLANLLAAIEEDRVEPDRRDVAMPEENVQAQDPSDGDGSAESASGADLTAELTTGRPPNWGVVLYPAVALGFSSTTPLAPGIATGAAVELIFAERLGPYLGFRVRRHAQQGYRFQGLQVAVGGQYERFGRNLGVALRLAGSIEPWRVAAEGETQALTADSSPDASTLLLGLGAAVVPGFRFPLGSLTGQLGLAVAASYAGVPQDGWSPADISLRGPGGEPTPLFRAGGFELQVGLELGLRFASR